MKKGFLILLLLLLCATQAFADAATCESQRQEWEDLEQVTSLTEIKLQTMALSFLKLSVKYTFSSSDISVDAIALHQQLLVYAEKIQQLDDVYEQLIVLDCSDSLYQQKSEALLTKAEKLVVESLKLKNQTEFLIQGFTEKFTKVELPQEETERLLE